MPRARSATQRPASQPAGSVTNLVGPFGLEPPDLNAFELVEPVGGLQRSNKRNRPPNYEPGATGNIESLSDNLIVAPAKSADLFRPRASSNAQFDPLANGSLSGNIQLEPTGTGNSRQPAGSYLERLSSVELLFLISSLMFLVLLALGLAGSFYCFRRQAAQQSRARASAILRQVESR